MIENIDIGGPDADPRGGEEPRVLRRGRHAGELRRRARGAARSRTGSCRCRRARASRWRRSRTPPATTRRSRAGSPSARTTSRRSTRARSRRCSTSPTARTRTSARRTTRETGARTHLLSMVSKLHGKELSFNNLLDLDSGRRLVEEFELPAAAIIKHNNPCGCGGRRRRSRTRSTSALATDPQSAFGGVFCFNRPVDARARGEAATRCSSRLVFAPGYDDDALEVLEQKPNIRCSRTRSGARCRSPSTTSSACAAGCWCRTATRGSRSASEMQRGHRAQADRGGVGRAAVRHARVQARALERDRAGARPRRRSGSARGR